MGIKRYHYLSGHENLNRIDDSTSCDLSRLWREPSFQLTGEKIRERCQETDGKLRRQPDGDLLPDLSTAHLLELQKEIRYPFVYFPGSLNYLDRFLAPLNSLILFLIVNERSSEKASEDDSNHTKESSSSMITDEMAAENPIPLLSDRRRALFEPLAPAAGGRISNEDLLPPPDFDAMNYPKGWVVGKKRKLVNVDVVESMRRIAVQEMNRKVRNLSRCLTLSLPLFISSVTCTFSLRTARSTV